MSVSTSTPPATLVDDAPYQSMESVVNEDVEVRLFDSSVKSPYMDTEIISLDVGPTQTRYRVHRAILAQSSELDAKPSLKLWGEKTHDTISLPELDNMTAHTLVHYLYTGRYNTLEPRDACPRTALSQYKLGTCAYCAAIRYKLSGLAELAKKIMMSLQEDLSILDVLVVAREHAFPLLPDDESWFAGYLEDAIHAAVTKDADLFTRPGFVDQIEGDRRYRQVVMKAIVNSYAQPATASPAAQDKEQQRRPSTLSRVVAIANHDTDRNTDEALLEEITPSLEGGHVAPEPYSDELGWESSKTFQSQKMGAAKATAETVSGKPPHVRVDSAVGVDVTPGTVPVEKSEPTEKIVPVKTDVASAPPSDDQINLSVSVDSAAAQETVPVKSENATSAADEATSPVANGVDGGAGAASKKNNKKKNKKKNAGTTF